MRFRGLETPVKPDWEALIANLRRQGTPRRVHHLELFQDGEIAQAIADRYGLMAGVSRDDPHYERKKHVAVQRFCGFDYVGAALVRLDFSMFHQTTADTAALARSGGRSFQDEHKGPIMSWDDFER
ncbi:MAG: hypothetical protein IMZ62_11995, partial [Chloroflexi bacterium]|nr:hypothetical protein [Chloroflexota bacterium]